MSDKTHQGVGVITVDGECRILSMNGDAERITGLRTANVVGIHFCHAVMRWNCSTSAERPGCLFRRAIEGRERRSKPREIWFPVGGPAMPFLLGARSVDAAEVEGAAIITFRHAEPREDLP